MKIRLLFVVLCLAIGALAGTTNSLKLVWDYPTNEVSDDLAFILRVSPDVAVPLTNWPVKTVVGATNAIAQTNAVVVGTNWVFTTPITNQPGKWFFYATATNVWGESDPSNVAGTPPLPAKGQLRITR